MYILSQEYKNASKLQMLSFIELSGKCITQNYIQGEICIGSYYILLYKFKMNQITLNMTYKKVEGEKEKKKKPNTNLNYLRCATFRSVNI